MCSICDYRCEIGENSLWHDIEKYLYWCEIPTGRLFRYDPGNGKHEQSPSPICRCQKFDCVAKKIAVGTCCFRFGNLHVEPWSSRARATCSQWAVVGFGACFFLSHVDHRWGRDDTQNRLKGVPFQAARRS